MATATPTRLYTDADRAQARAQADSARAARAMTTHAKAKPKGTGKAPSDEAGVGGRPTWGGTLTGSETDHVQAWQIPNRWTTIPQMLGDPDVAAVLSAITLPLRAVTMTVEPGSKDELDVDVAAFIQRDFENMTCSLAGHRAEALDYLPWGVSLFETVYRQSPDDGLWHLRKLAARPANTISDWLLDDTGGPAGVVQAAARGGTREMEMDRLLAFTHDRRGGDLTGRSILRPVYGPWMLKTELAKTGAVAAYRNGVGIPTIRYTGQDDDTHSAYQSALMGLHAHAKAFMLLTDLESMADFAIKGVEGSLIDVVPQLEHHRAAVYTATLCQFLLLGTGETGSFALSADHSSFLLLALQAVLDEVADSYNRYLIPRFVGYNWGAAVPADRMPKVTFGRLDRTDLTAWFAAVKTAREAGVTLTPRALEEQAHERLGLPLPEYAGDHPDGGVADVNNPNDDGNDPGAAIPDPVAATGATGYAERRPLQAAVAVDLKDRTKAEGRARAAAEADKVAARARDREKIGDACTVCGAKSNLQAHHVDGVNTSSAIQTVCKSCHDEWDGYTHGTPRNKSRITATALEALRGRSGKTTHAEPPTRLESLVKLEALGIAPEFVRMSAAMDDAAARLKKKLAALQAKAADYAIRKALEAAKKGDPSILLDMAISGDQEAEAIAEELGLLYDQGIDEIDGELGQQGVKAARPSADDEKDRRAVLAAVGAVMAAMLVDRLTTAARMAGVGQIATGTADRAAIEARVAGAPDSLLADLTDRAVAIGLGSGRDAALTANADKVDRVMYSAAMDANTCGPCAALDGQEFTLEDAPAIPNPDCDGGEKCRCELVPVAA